MAFRGVDYLLIDSQFSEQELLVRQTARRFVDERVLPLIRDCFPRGALSPRTDPGNGALGFLGANLEGYGCAGMSNVEYGLVMQEIERGDSGLRSFVSVQGALVMYPILTYGSEEQKARLAAAAAVGDGDRLLRPDRAGLRIESRRRCGPRARTATAITGCSTARRPGSRTAPWRMSRWCGRAPEDGIRGFLVERGTPGFTTSEIHGKWSMRASVTSSLAFADCRVPDSAMLPGAKGLKAPLACLSQARYGIGWGVIGAAMDCYETARAYAVLRKQFDDRPHRLPSTGAGEAGLDDHGDHQGAVAGAAVRPPEGRRASSSRRTSRC